MQRAKLTLSIDSEETPILDFEDLRLVSSNKIQVKNKLNITDIVLDWFGKKSISIQIRDLQ